MIDFGPYTAACYATRPTRDGIAWSAVIYRGDQRVGTVRDEGHGGELQILLEAAERLRILAHVQALPPVPLVEGGSPYPLDLGLFVCALADAAEARANGRPYDLLRKV